MLQIDEESSRHLEHLQLKP